MHRGTEARGCVNHVETDTYLATVRTIVADHCRSELNNRMGSFERRFGAVLTRDDFCGSIAEFEVIGEEV